VSDDRFEREDDLAADDLDTGLRNRLRDARASGGDLTRSELLELAEALTAQRREMAAALADLARREQEVADVRAALERTSQEAARALDERDARLSALASELELERSRLDHRELELTSAPGPEPAHHARFDGLESVLAELRDRLDRVESALAARVRTVPEVIFGPSEDRDDRVKRAVELVGELARVLRSPLEKLAHDEPPLETAREVDEPTRSDEPAAPEERPERQPAAGHVLFVSTEAGYRLFGRDGPLPPPGERVRIDELGGIEATITGERPSPFPGDGRSCLACVTEPGGPRMTEPQHEAAT
jgi:hypothetical protein